MTCGSIEYSMLLIWVPNHFHVRHPDGRSSMKRERVVDAC